MVGNTKVLAVAVLVALVIGAAGGYWYGDRRGYSRAEADAKKIQEAAAKKAVDDAAKVANPFQAVNPLEGVNANPFQKAKNLLNPFQ